MTYHLCKIDGGRIILGVEPQGEILEYIEADDWETARARVPLDTIHKPGYGHFLPGDA